METMKLNVKLVFPNAKSGYLEKVKKLGEGASAQMC